jgi:hypothetical protein
LPELSRVSREVHVLLIPQQQDARRGSMAAALPNQIVLILERVGGELLDDFVAAERCYCSPEVDGRKAGSECIGATDPERLAQIPDAGDVDTAVREHDDAVETAPGFVENAAAYLSGPVHCCSLERRSSRCSHQDRQRAVTVRALPAVRVAHGEVVAGRGFRVDLHIELIIVERQSGRVARVVDGTWQHWFRVEGTREERRCDRIDAIERNLIVRKWIANDTSRLIRPGRQRVVQLLGVRTVEKCREVPAAHRLRNQRNRAGFRSAPSSRRLVVAEEKGAIPCDWPSRRTTKHMLPEWRLAWVERIRRHPLARPVRRVQRIVTEELEHRAMSLVGSPLGRDVDDATLRSLISNVVRSTASGPGSRRHQLRQAGRLDARVRRSRGHSKVDRAVRHVLASRPARVIPCLLAALLSHSTISGSMRAFRDKGVNYYF